MSKLDDFFTNLLVWGLSLYLVFGGFYWVYTAIKVGDIFVDCGCRSTCLDYHLTHWCLGLPVWLWPNEVGVLFGLSAM